MMNEVLAAVAESLASLANALMMIAEGAETKKVEDEVKKEEPKATEPEKKEEAMAPEPEPKEDPEPEPEKKKAPKLTMEDVRKALSAKSSAGYTAEVRDLLERHGATKLSGIQASEYAAIMEEVQKIGGSQ